MLLGWLLKCCGGVVGLVVGVVVVVVVGMLWGCCLRFVVVLVNCEKRLWKCCGAVGLLGCCGDVFGCIAGCSCCCCCVGVVGVLWAFNEV